MQKRIRKDEDKKLSNKIKKSEQKRRQGKPKTTLLVELVLCCL